MEPASQWLSHGSTQISVDTGSNSWYNFSGWLPLSARPVSPTLQALPFFATGVYHMSKTIIVVPKIVSGYVVDSTEAGCA